MRTKLSIVLDSVILFAVLWLLFFAWIRFYTRNMLVSIVAGTILAGLIVFLVLFLNKKRSDKLNLSKQQKDKASRLLLNLRFTSVEQISRYFATILEKTHTTVLCNDFVILKENSAQNSMHSILHSTNKMLLAPYFTKDKIDMPYFTYIYKCAAAINIKHVAFVGAEFDSEVINFARQINGYTFEFIDFYKFYDEYIKDSGVQLPVVIDITKPKMQWRELVQYAFSPARARNYLLFGLLIILCSFLVPFKIYYLVSGSILCLIALLVRVVPLLRKNQ